MISKKRENYKRNTGATRIKKLFIIIGSAVLILLCVFLLVMFQNVKTKIQAKPIYYVERCIKEIEKAVQIFKMSHNGKLPDSLEELIRGTDENPSILNDTALNDAWGTPFTYSKSEKTFTITSAGPDRKLGTADDITN